ncbi:hypothetical protein, partial [Bifidobacterium mongoliense]|uniref:hypothetical protein n=1 Tax=Bifidobacterium mongoliense TaxID=518643 RepID=UPI0026481B2F
MPVGAWTGTVPPTRNLHRPGCDLTTAGPKVNATTSTRNAQSAASMKNHGAGDSVTLAMVPLPVIESIDGNDPERRIPAAKLATRKESTIQMPAVIS